MRPGGKRRCAGAGVRVGEAVGGVGVPAEAVPSFSSRTAAVAVVGGRAVAGGGAACGATTDVK